MHGRARDPARPDEVHFGPFRRMLRAALEPPRDGAQWTGITTRLAERLLETGAVDAVLTMAPDPDDRWRPVPVLVTDAEGMAQCRGMRMGYAPLLALLEPARARGYQAPRRHRHPLPGLCAARAGDESWASSALRHRHALLRQHHDRELPRIPRPAVDRPGDHHLSGIPRRLSRRAALRRRPGAGDPVPAAADLASCRRILPAHLPHLRRLHQRAGRHHRRLHGRPGRAMAAGAQRARRGTAGAARRRGRVATPGSAGKRAAAGEGLPGEHRARRRRPAAAPHAELAAADRGLADAAHRPARAWNSPARGSR